ncbi:MULTISPECIES: beta strand repeat-containing protein [Acidaminococcus]|jgi:hypothetical protein|uniref:beta strand repeat-containing protein n=2 Tax=Acidaminococcaceae TaxID=909930 RepID=UPI000CF8AB4C|nr:MULTISPECIES: hypothetical protein [Acidaminococcus]RHK01135.1 hypothetical protein DW089_07990 [Acidaminococcus sp. AM05-11]
MGSKEQRSCTAVILSSILGMGLYAAPAMADPVTVTGAITQAETTGNSDTGTASGNTLTVTEATLDLKRATVYGGKAADEQAGSASKNTVTVTNSSLTSLDIVGGYSSGPAEGNTVIIASTSAVGSITGGNGNNASNNRVEIYGSSGPNYGGFVDAGDALGNYVLIDTAADNIGTTYGGFSLKGDANANTVEVKSGVVNQAIGGNGENTANNRVIMSGGTDHYMLIGGYANGYGGTSSNNQVTLTGGEITYNDSQMPAASGGWAPFGSADQNSVEISGTAAVAGNVYGGGSLLGNAANNTVKISSGTVGGNVAGGAALNAGTSYSLTPNPTNATGNTVEISGTAAAAGNVYGGYVNLYVDYYIPTATAPVGDASQNTVKISDVSLSGDVYGGYTVYGDATGNTTSLTSTTLSGDAYGGYTAHGTASGNTVSLTNVTADTQMKEIVGGRALIGTASDNTVTVEGGTYFNVYGGATGSAAEYEPIASLPAGVTETGDATGNTLIIKGGTIFTAAAGRANELEYTNAEGNTENLAKGDTTGNTLYVYDGDITAAVGGYGGTNVKDNTASMSGGTAARLVGGATILGEEGTISGNHVSLSGGTVTYYVIGGEGAEAEGASTVSDNSVSISGGTVAQNVAAGTTVSGDATGNTLTISGGTIGTTEGDTNYIVGGASVQGAANDNTVTITGGTLGTMMSLYGGYSELESTGNTLNFYTKDQTVKNLDYFQTLNFYVPAGTVPGETMLEVTDTADVHGAAVNGGIDDSVKLSPGQVINLLHDANTISTTGTTYSMITGKDVVTDPGFVQHKVLIKEQDPNTIVLYIPAGDKGFLNPDTKLIPEQREAAISELVNASDLAATQGYASAVAAYEAAWLEDHSVEAKFIPYAVIGGHDLRYDTGSYVDSQGLNTELGFVKRTFDGNHADTLMPFAEYGNGNYTSHLDSGARSDGDQHYLGAGLLLRRDLRSGLHYEGMLRAGYLSGDFRGVLAGHRASYDTGSQYIAAHLGLGKIISKGQDDFDYYGKFYWTHLGSDTTAIHTNLGSGDYHLDSVNSYRTRLGLRWTRHLGAQNTIYAGLGWDYEFDGEARAQYREFSTPAPSVQGSSGMLELGWQSKATKENPWGADLRVTGWTGAQRGVTYGVTISRRL